VIAAEQNPTASFYATAPDPSRKAWATTELSFNPTASGYRWQAGERLSTPGGEALEEVMPADVLKACVERGDVTFDEREAKRIKAAKA
jgi:hypothetical protein